MVNPWVVLLAALGIGGAAYAFYQRKRGALLEAAVPAAGALDYGPGPLVTLPGLGLADLELIGKSPKLASDVRKVQQDKTKSPKEIVNLAKEFQRKGYPMVAAELVENALQRAEKLGGWPYVIGATDTPGSVAQRYTGNWRRWTELIGQRVGFTKLSYYKKGSIEGLKPWQPGFQIMLPLPWKTRP